MSDDTVVLRGQRHVIWQCGICGVTATCPEIVYNQHRAEGGFHHCPNGHSWGWRKDTCERERLRLERDRLKQQIAQKDDEIKWQEARRQDAERQAIAAKGQITKLKNRAAADVCPCCNRTFSQLSRHMAKKHPAFKSESADNIIRLASPR